MTMQMQTKINKILLILAALALLGVSAGCGGSGRDHHHLWRLDKGNGRNLDRIVERYLQAPGLRDEVKDRLHTPASGLSIGQ
jgi:hypothetical protein